MKIQWASLAQFVATPYDIHRNQSCPYLYLRLPRERLRKEKASRVSPESRNRDPSLSDFGQRSYRTPVEGSCVNFVENRPKQDSFLRRVEDRPWKGSDFIPPSCTLFLIYILDCFHIPQMFEKEKDFGPTDWSALFHVLRSRPCRADQASSFHSSRHMQGLISGSSSYRSASLDLNKVNGIK